MHQKKDPVDGDQDGKQYFSKTKEGKKYYSIKCCDVRDS